MSQLRKCGKCGGTFKWNDDVIVVEEEHLIYHKDCVRDEVQAFQVISEGRLQND